MSGKRSDILPIDVLFQAEVDGGVLEPSIEGFAFWPVVRFPAWQLVSQVDAPTRSGGWRAWLRSRPSFVSAPVFAAWTAWQRRRLPRNDQVCFFLSDESYRSVRSAGGWWDVYFDDLVNASALAGRIGRCEMRRFFWPLWPTAAPRGLFADGLILRLMRSQVGRANAAHVHAGAQTAEAFFSACDRQGLAIDDRQRTVFRATCLRSATAFSVVKRWFGALFDRHHPRVFALVGAYSWHGAVAAALERGMPVVEFQHGVITRGHSAYIWPGVLRDHRPRLPLPTHIATYGRFWSGILREQGFWQDAEVRAVGSVRMDRVREETSGGCGECDEGTVTILFTSQFPVRAEAIAFFASFLEQAKLAEFDFRLIIKVHRAEASFQRDYDGLCQLSDRVKVMSPFEGDTLALIASADVHLSAWSTCHYEALALGTPTIVMCLSDFDHNSDLKGLTGVREVTTPVELLAMLEAMAAGRIVNREPSGTAETLFEPGAVENAVSLLMELSGGQA